MTPRPINDVRAEVGESALWDPRAGCLYTVDVWGRALWRHDLASGAAKPLLVPEMAACVVLAEPGVLIGCETHLLAAAPGAWRRIEAPPGHPATHRFNDAVVDPRGRLIIGTMKLSALGAEPSGTLYRLDRGGWEVIDEGLWILNGTAMSPDGRTLYYSDSHPDVRTIWARDYDAESGALGERRVFVDTAGMAGRPDSASTDAEGNYWIAGINGGVVYGFAPDGRLIREIAVPVENPTRVAFAGEELKTMVVTSMRVRLTRPDPDNLAGATFAFDAGVAGWPTHRAILE
ncbi:SMP-30/gluconolactonase/LRE family protein [Sandaracinobacteroides saxicola]|uniref:SMP-30/gluconolactonase/LRE family protein n=1 Tax=Sandaracinobacteroides saxicola TaxID=2759707 RepID=A0A7G5IDL6_9SPHN|nr:SMP-30/gluconolactonase/LRE family protein [Sandaracinobacteroides saxicola]QMW21458.1 SMP-30/gluconolactonase/LRE family protein [Sandaracinobacteroides saxicola]